MGPIKTDFIHFKKCDLLNNRILIGIDFGCSLTKFVFLNKKDSHELFNKKSDRITLQYAIFSKQDVESGLKYLKEAAFIPKNTTMKIHGSGLGCLAHREKIESILGLKFVFVKKELCEKAGYKIAFQQIGVENMKYPSVELDDYGKIENQVLTKTGESFTERMSSNNNEMDKGDSSHFPCLVLSCGSMLTYIYYDENGKEEQIGSVEIGGTTFLGMAKCLLDINNYDEIMDLATKGDRCHMDLQIKDVLDMEIESPYGQIPSEMPIFSFGKCFDKNIGLENFPKRDVASSLVALYSMMIIESCHIICLRKKVKQIYCCGNTFQSKIFQKEIKMSNLLSWIPVDLEYTILNSGFCTALGAMFSSDTNTGKR